MYTVKKIKTFRGHEGEGFNAELYRDGKKISRKINGLLVPVHVVAVEKKEPFRCGVWRISDDTLASATRENEAAIRRLLDCRKRDAWPTGYEDVRELIIP